MWAVRPDDQRSVERTRLSPNAADHAVLLDQSDHRSLGAHVRTGLLSHVDEQRVESDSPNAQPRCLESLHEFWTRLHAYVVDHKAAAVKGRRSGAEQLVEHTKALEAGDSRRMD